MSDNRLEALAAFLASHPDLPKGHEPEATIETAPSKRLPKLTISMERKGRGGKTATIISGFASPEQAAETASMLKKRLATGGSARGCEVLVQGDCRDEVRRILAEMA